MERGEDAAAAPVALTPILIVEDDLLMQPRLQGILVGLGCDPNEMTYAASLAEARECLANGHFSCALVDVGLPDGRGIDLIAEMQTQFPDIQSVVISSFGARDIVMAALHAGAIGYLMKDRSDAEIAILLNSIRDGGSPIDPFVARSILAYVSRTAKPDVTPAPPADAAPLARTLSKRELQILQLVSEGLTNREIAESVDLSRQTVECHTKSIYRKLVVSSRTEAVYRARQHGLLP